MGAFDDLAGIPPQDLFEGVAARAEQVVRAGPGGADSTSCTSSTASGNTSFHCSRKRR